MALLLFSAGCVAMDESGIEGAMGVEGPFGPASMAGMWKGESNWDGTIKEIRVLVRKPTVERLITPTPSAPIENSGVEASLPGRKPAGQQAEKAISPAPAVPAWEKVPDEAMSFWGWDIFIKGSEKELFFNIQIIFTDDGNGKLTVVSQSGGSGEARFIQEGEERRIEVALDHPMLKEIKGRILCNRNRIIGSFTLLGKEGVFKLEPDNIPNPAEKQE